MKSILLRLLSLLACGFLCATSVAQLPAGGRISGIVADSVDKKVMDYITINLLTDQKVAVRADFTKTDGSFVLDRLKPGNYVVVFAGVGYKQKMIPVDLSDTTRPAVNLGKIELAPVTIGLKEVKITAIKPIVKQEVDRITYDMQADPENKVFNALEMMRKVPLLSVDADNNVYLKGNSDFRILINGKLSSMMERNYRDILRTMPASSIERIEVITTPPAKYDAEGLAGIINIITHKNVDNGYSGTINASERFPVGGPGLGGTFSAKFGKLGMTFMTGGNQYRTPDIRTSSQRDTRGTNPTHLFQNGITRNSNYSGYLGYEISYEIDTLNLVSAQFNINGSRGNGFTFQNSLLNADTEILEHYQVDNQSRDNGRGMDAALNYQRSAKADKNRLLTLSYRYYGFTNNQKGNVAMTDRVNFDLPDYRQFNDQQFSEQTMQVDYVYPVKKLNIEAGLKAIMRDNSSDFRFESFNSESTTFNPDLSRSNRFTYTQNVFGAYNTYQYTFKKWGLKAGARIEQTIVRADFISTDSKVDQTYFNVVPSLAINRKLKNNAGVNFGYTQRIQRPGIYQLNPFVDRSNPNFERSGSPALRPAFVNDFQVGYAKSKKGSVNVGIGYTNFRDMIMPVAVFDPETNITRATFGNTGRARLFMVLLTANYPITKNWNFSLNSRVAHGRVSGVVNGQAVSNEGVMYQANVSTGYKLPNGWRVNGNLTMLGPNINIQGTTNSMVSSSWSASKDLFKDKVSFSAAVNNPFTKFRNARRETFGPNFNQQDIRRDFFRTFNLTLNYKFGKLKDSIKKNKRGIRNDDVQNSN
ncbi:outer membrane beta-barrel family protein [Larkinella rosea]|uniref:TonB-dependent receptor n=1 Tax=Larkinella rosea TaxID=2025312 RepID=A0A3P1BZ78_9BACT|nr:outer membrane beta-barrel family protein [Larkinella rosea]RRB06441.1 TonB-dependent receptor [Larkinella rosea]